MTIEDIRKSKSAFLTPNDVAEVLGCAPQGIRDAARKNPQALGFPVTVIGNRTRIPRIPFLEFVMGR